MTNLNIDPHEIKGLPSMKHAGVVILGWLVAITSHIVVAHMLIKLLCFIPSWKQSPRNLVSVALSLERRWTSDVATYFTDSSFRVV